MARNKSSVKKKFIISSMVKKYKNQKNILNGELMFFFQKKNIFKFNIL